MSVSSTIDEHVAWFEFCWLAAVGMNVFLFAAAAGSTTIMLAGMMMWTGFAVLAGRFRVTPVLEHPCDRADSKKLGVQTCVVGVVADLTLPQRFPDGAVRDSTCLLEEADRIPALIEDR